MAVGDATKAGPIGGAEAKAKTDPFTAAVHKAWEHFAPTKFKDTDAGFPPAVQATLKAFLGTSQADGYRELKVAGVATYAVVRPDSPDTKAIQVVNPKGDVIATGHTDDGGRMHFSWK